MTAFNLLLDLLMETVGIDFWGLRHVNPSVSRILRASELFPQNFPSILVTPNSGEARMA